MKETHHSIEPPHSPGRLDSVLASHLDEFSRSRIQKLIREGHVRVNGEEIHKPSHKLEGDELLEIELPEVQRERIGARA